MYFVKVFHLPETREICKFTQRKQMFHWLLLALIVVVQCVNINSEASLMAGTRYSRSVHLPLASLH